MSSEINDGGPAFPSRGGMMFYVPKDAEGGISEAIQQMDQKHEGLSLRDYFAAKAMQAVIISTEGKDGLQRLTNEQMVEGQCGAAYLYADAMLAAREDKS